MKNDCYKILGVPQSASVATIKQRYRVLSKIHHPDLNDNADSKVMAKINAAYDTLSDPSKRSSYDYIYYKKPTSEVVSNKSTATSFTRKQTYHTSAKSAQAKKSRKSTWAFAYSIMLILSFVASAFLVWAMNQPVKIIPTDIPAPSRPISNTVTNTTPLTSLDAPVATQPTSTSSDSFQETPVNDEATDTDNQIPPNNDNPIGTTCVDGTVSYAVKDICALHGGIATTPVSPAPTNLLP